MFFLLPLYLLQIIMFVGIAVYVLQRRPRHKGKSAKSYLRFAVEVAIVALAGDKLVELLNVLYIDSYRVGNRLYGTRVMALHYLAHALPYLCLILICGLWYCVLKHAKPPHHSNDASESIAELLA